LFVCFETRTSFVSIYIHAMILLFFCSI